MELPLRHSAAKLFAALTILFAFSACEFAWAEEAVEDKIVGMYVHQHWPYNRPYAARSWTLADWEGYIDGLQRLGFNTIKIWPVLETMPKPLTTSDAASLEKIRQVIDLIHEKKMRVIIALCPNIVADSAVAKEMVFEDRYFFYCDVRVNPADQDDIRSMIRWREELFRPLAKVDAVSIIDSDPGGYPGSNNEQFVNLLVEHRKMFDRLRPGIELLYWMHAGWPGYCRYYETGNFAMSQESEFLDALQKLAQANPEPWGLAGNIFYANKVNLASRAIDYRYGAIEAEPSFPFTNFGGDGAHSAAKGTSGRGVMGNAQTHCLQLPNTFAFSRGAQGLPLQDSDYVAFANDLLPGHGVTIVEGWKALKSGSTTQMYATADTLETLSQQDLQVGPLKGLLFGETKRFLMDIAIQLRLQAGYEEFCSSAEEGASIREPFSKFAAQFSNWQQRHGYEGRTVWANWPRLDSALDKLGSPEIDAARRPSYYAKVPFAKVKEEYAFAETASARLVSAMNILAEEMNADETYSSQHAK